MDQNDSSKNELTGHLEEMKEFIMLQLDTNTGF